MLVADLFWFLGFVVLRLWFTCRLVDNGCDSTKRMYVSNLLNIVNIYGNMLVDSYVC